MAYGGNNASFDSGASRTGGAGQSRGAQRAERGEKKQAPKKSGLQKDTFSRQTQASTDYKFDNSKRGIPQKNRNGELLNPHRLELYRRQQFYEKMEQYPVFDGHRTVYYADASKAKSEQAKINMEREKSANPGKSVLGTRRKALAESYTGLITKQEENEMVAEADQLIEEDARLIESIEGKAIENQAEAD